MADEGKFNKMRAMHGKELYKAHAVKDVRKKAGNVKSWLEVMVLLDDKAAKQAAKSGSSPMMPGSTPQPMLFSGSTPAVPKAHQVLQHVMSGDGKQMIKAAGQVFKPVTPTLQSKGSSPALPKAASNPMMVQPLALDTPHREILVEFAKLPAPTTDAMTKGIPRVDRDLYDAALDEQLKIHQAALTAMVDQQMALDREIAAKREALYQMQQQQAMVQAQKEEREKRKQAAAEKLVAQQAPVAAPQIAGVITAEVREAADKATTAIEGESLHSALTRFFTTYEPAVTTDGRLERIITWTEERGVDKLCAMLRDQYGTDLFGRRNAEESAVDQVQADRVARRLMGFYKAFNTPTTWAKCLQLGEWASRRGEAALNTKLRAKYNDDLESFAKRTIDSLEPRLKSFYLRVNPQIAEPRHLEPILQWAAFNGLPALNAILVARYGEDLDGVKNAPPSARVSSSVPAAVDAHVSIASNARAILHRELEKAPQGRPRGETVDAVETRKDTVLKQLASFLEAKDPVRLQTEGGLSSLVQWALPRDDEQLDGLLTETYGTNLTTEGLRDLTFDEREIKAWEKLPAVGLATKAVQDAAIETDKEMERIEERSMRASTSALVLPKGAAYTEALAAEDIPEPDF